MGRTALQTTPPGVRICAADPNIYFLLIGDGNYKYQVDDAVKAAGLEHRVISSGRVAQTEGARLLRACDVYVSPHSSLAMSHSAHGTLRRS